ncbi:MAG: FxsA family protein [Deltaproteobacteria bacterium]|nr:FxsA family protein [Deltaproteobacteria bacterium]
MGVLAKIFFSILIYLFVEIYVFVEASILIGFFPAAILLISFSIIGYMITKRIKGISFQKAAADYANGESPSKNLVKTAGFFISGVLFLIPGFITDFIAILFLIPFLNYYLMYLIFRYFKNKFNGSYAYQSQNGGGDFNGGSFTFISLPFKKNGK